MTDIRAPGERLWGRLTLIGGGLAVIAALFPWARVVTDRTATSLRGTAAGAGLAALACGALLVLLGRSMRRSEPPAGRVRGAVGAALGLIIVALAVSVLATHDRQVEDGIRGSLEAGGAGPPSPTAVRQAHAELVTEGLEATFGPGVYLALAGGVLAALGGAGVAAQTTAARKSLQDPAIIPAEPQPRMETDRWDS
jgi:hypothetical protein